MRLIKSYRYKNITFLIFSLIFAVILVRDERFHSILLHVGNLGYLGAFIGGLFFTSTFTIATGTIILLVLAESLSPVLIAVIAGAGAVIGDLTIFQFVRSRSFVDEIKHIFEFFGGEKIHHLIHTKYFSWTLPVVGALIIASPLPDELGISLMGISRLKTRDFVILSFILNSIGVFVIISVSAFIKP